MYLTKRSLQSAQHGSTFFLAHPHTVENFEKTIQDAGGIPQLFHKSAALFQKEISEHDSSEDAVKTTKSSIRALSKTLRRAAYSLERAMNSLLELSGAEDIEIDFARSENDVADYESLVAQVKQHENLLAENATVQKSFTKFETELAQYRVELSEIGDAMAQELKEEKEVDELTAQYHPVVSALSDCLRRYFYYTNKDLYNEWRIKKTTTTKKTTSETSETSPV